MASLPMSCRSAAVCTASISDVVPRAHLVRKRARKTLYAPRVRRGRGIPRCHHARQRVEHRPGAVERRRPPFSARFGDWSPAGVSAVKRRYTRRQERHEGCRIASRVPAAAPCRSRLAGGREPSGSRRKTLLEINVAAGWRTAGWRARFSGPGMASIVCRFRPQLTILGADHGPGAGAGQLPTSKDQLPRHFQPSTSKPIPNAPKLQKQSVWELLGRWELGMPWKLAFGSW